MAGGLHQWFDGLQRRLAANARARDLRHREQPQAAGGVGQAAVVKALRPALEAVLQIGAHAAPGWVGQRFDPELLQHVEHRSGDGLGGAELPVQGLVGQLDAQRQPVGRTAEAGQIVVRRRRVQVRRDQRQPPAARGADAGRAGAGRARPPGPGSRRCTAPRCAAGRGRFAARRQPRWPAPGGQRGRAGHQPTLLSAGLAPPSSLPKQRWKYSAGTRASTMAASSAAGR